MSIPRLKLLTMLVLIIVVIAYSEVAAAPFAYIPNTGPNGSITVIDTETSSFVTEILNAGDHPYGVAITPNNKYVYITCIFGNNVTVIDAENNIVIDHIPTGSYPLSITMNPEGTTAYVTNRLGASITVIDINSNTVIHTIPVSSRPVGVIVHPSGKTVYIAHENGSGIISIIDIATGTVVEKDVGCDPEVMAFHHDGQYLYLGLVACHEVAVFDTNTNTVVEIIPVGQQPNGMAVNPSGTELFVANRNSGTVSVIDTTDNIVINTIDIGGYPYGVSITPDGSKIYVTNSTYNNVYIIDSIDLDWETIPTGVNPTGRGVFIGSDIRNVPVSLDIKPGSCPNTVNVRSNGVLPAAILGSEELDVYDIDPSTILLNGVAPLRFSYEDVETAYLADELLGAYDCLAWGPDGYIDLTLKFNTQAIVDSLGEVSDGDEILLNLRGNLWDGTPIEGEDFILIKARGECRGRCFSGRSHHRHQNPSLFDCKPFSRSSHRGVRYFH